MSLLQEVEAYQFRIFDEAGISLAPDEKIVTAVSGGPDSLALLHLLAKRGLHPAENIIVAHLDHQLRPSSAADSEHVCRIAEAWGMVCRTRQVDVKHLSETSGLSIEEAGRQERYRFLAEVAAEFKARFIFTGHHADDQVETIVMHMLRGSGSAGLRGMLPVSALPGEAGLWLVRPLLNTSREAIEAYCDQHKLEPLIDESNTDTTFFRNRLRHDLMPILESYNPTIRERLLTMAAVTAAEFDWLQQQAAAAWDDIHLETGQGWLRLDLAGWQTLPLALRRHTLRMAVGLLRPNLRDVGFETIEQARLVAENGKVGAESSLPGEMILSVEYSTFSLRLVDAKGFTPELPQLPSKEPQTLSIPGQLSLRNGWILKCEVLEKLDPRFILHNDNSWTAYMDVGTADSLTVRPRLPGERFHPFGFVGHTKSVKAVMIDDKIPAAFRPRWPIVAGKHLYWIPGAIMDERVRVSPKSARAIKLTLERIVG